MLKGIVLGDLHRHAVYPMSMSMPNAWNAIAALGGGRYALNRHRLVCKCTQVDFCDARERTNGQCSLAIALEFSMFTILMIVSYCCELFIDERRS
jgi:hypothetical protein